MSDLNLVPSSTEVGSLSSTGVGTADAGHIEHGHVGGGGGDAAVVNDHVTLAASALPATSFTRGSVVPPLTFAVYVDETARATCGASVAVLLAGSYTTVAFTRLF